MMNLTTCFDSTESSVGLIVVAELPVLLTPRVPAVVVTPGVLVLSVVLGHGAPVNASLTILSPILRANVDPLIVLTTTIQSHLTVFFRS